MKQNLKILHLEDSATDAELVNRELKKGNIKFETCVVETENDFIKALIEFSPNIILSNYSLHSFNSLEALRIVRRTDMKIPFILLIANLSEEFAVDVMKQGADDYILKDRLQRLPSAILKAVEKCSFENERQKFIDEIIANEALMKEAERLAHFGSWQIDPIQSTVKWSDETYRILGYKPGEVEPDNENFLRNIHPDDKSQVKKIVEYSSDFDSQKFEFRVTSPKDNSLKYVFSELVIRRNTDKKPTRIIGFIQDITERKRIEDQNLKLSIAVDQSPSSIIITNYEGEIEYVNPKFLKLTGYSINEVLGKNPRILNSGELDSASYKKLWETIKSGFEWHGEFHNKKKNGELFWEWSSISPIKDSSGKITHFIAIKEDITEVKEAEESLKKMTNDLIQHNKNLEQFAYIVSHNLRAPVANIIGISDALRNVSLADNEKNVMMQGLFSSVKKLDEVILDLNHILQMKREVSEKKELVHFSKILNDIESSISNLIKKEQVEIKSDFTEVDEILTLKSYMYSIFYNLISNSIKYRRFEINPRIEIKSRKLKNKIELIFKDNGMGIDLQKKGNQVFGLYKRFHTHTEGKGLGLFMTKIQVETLGGKITVNSELNKGTEFKIEFDV